MRSSSFSTSLLVSSRGSHRILWVFFESFGRNVGEFKRVADDVVASKYLRPHRSLYLPSDSIDWTLSVRGAEETLSVGVGGMLTVPQQTLKPICSLYIPRMTQFFVHDWIESSCLICIQYCFDAFTVEVWQTCQLPRISRGFLQFLQSHGRGAHGFILAPRFYFHINSSSLANT